MTDHERGCQRAGCQQPATVTLSFRYDARQASLVDLSADKDPAYYDLCAAHADVLIVPRGWERLDRRTRTPDAEPDPGVVAEPTGAGAAPDRYAVLTAELPRLAQACGLTPSAQDTRGQTARRRRTREGGDAVDPAGGSDPGVPSAVAARRDTEPTARRPFEPVRTTVLADPAPASSRLDDDVLELEGQLQMPIEPQSRGVVVALTRSRNA